ncbi:uncharacterized protein K452DRAFT_309305 [Aplosporella prunicola CBS 121167]|uniref:Uncharacterized protein n=1 Tax=Aplosporella prunicola CBS 121167 TaxID=1176127 RepID=A0A6A6B9T4_9PEZI|nr:uncharacterized protein K452DRAFT_309305 [Aplosporella prunicola CBS 121167]KAF2140830.1 hypothetical protein K452DRAFT_309305 [Aplosporella prunicola CBS 121167]
MQFKTIALAFFVSLALSAPAENAGKEERAAQACPNGWAYCGECNGTSCKVAATNHPCKQGTKCTGEGGGDGAICGSDTIDFDNAFECPVKARFELAPARNFLIKLSLYNLF